MDFSLDSARARSPSGRRNPVKGKRSSGKQQLPLIGAAIFGVVLLLVGLSCGCATENRQGEFRRRRDQRVRRRR